MDYLTKEQIKRMKTTWMIVLNIPVVWVLVTVDRSGFTFHDYKVYAILLITWFLTMAVLLFSFDLMLITHKLHKKGKGELTESEILNIEDRVSEDGTIKKIFTVTFLDGIREIANPDPVIISNFKVGDTVVVRYNTINYAASVIDVKLSIAKKSSA